jgi:hypothetical protein
LIEELAQLLQRQAAALEVLESRLRALELLVMADDPRFVALALDELETASERIAALELGRVMALSVAGLSPDVTAAQLVAHAGPSAAELSTAVEELRAASVAVATARDRARAVVSAATTETRAQIAAAEAFSQV